VPRSSNTLLITLCIALPLVAVVVVIAIYWHLANRLPSYPAPQALLPHPNARDDYMAAGRLCRAVHGSEVLAATGAPLQRNGRPVLAYDEEVSLSQLRASVTRSRPALARLRQGFGKRFGTPPVLHMEQQFPELANYRELARALVAEGKLAEREGRMRDAARSYLDCLRLGADAPRGGVLIHGLVGIAIHAIGLNAFQPGVNHLDGPTAAAAAHQMGLLERDLPPFTDTMIAERELVTASTIDMFQHPEKFRQLADSGSGGSTQAGSGGGWFTRLFIGLVPKRRVLEKLRGGIDAMIADSRKPYDPKAKPPPLPSDLWSRLLLPVYQDARPKWLVRDACWRIVETQLAERAYQARYGAPPTSLAGLVPAYLPAVPSDPFGGGALVYRRVGHRALIYCRGFDGDDDGGLDLGTGARPGLNGDIVTVRKPKTVTGQSVW
jgi:hypothetical protein